MSNESAKGVGSQDSGIGPRVPSPISPAPALSESLVDIAWRELESEICFCGAAKHKRRSFCLKCYYALPTGLRNRLYRSMADGYTEYYDEAKDFLKNETNRIRR